MISENKKISLFFGTEEVLPTLSSHLRAGGESVRVETWMDRLRTDTCVGDKEFVYFFCSFLFFTICGARLKLKPKPIIQTMDWSSNLICQSITCLSLSNHISLSLSLSNPVSKRRLSVIWSFHVSQILFFIFFIIL
jgi:hypothetical protein